jgi:hypothetical protein
MKATARVDLLTFAPMSHSYLATVHPLELAFTHAKSDSYAHLLPVSLRTPSITGARRAAAGSDGRHAQQAPSAYICS